MWGNVEKHVESFCADHNLFSASAATIKEKDMGTRINVLVDHRVPDYKDRAAVIARLEPTLPAAIAVRDYWIANDPESSRNDCCVWSTSTVPGIQPKQEYLFYEGPGSLWLRFGVRVAYIFTGGRWRGFLSTNMLHKTHLAAFRSIARALGGTRMVLYGEYDPIDQAAVLDGKTLDECVGMLNELWGSPQPTVDVIDPKVVAATDHCSPPVWYYQMLDDV